MENKNSNSKALQYVALTIYILACCIILYFMNKTVKTAPSSPHDDALISAASGVFVQIEVLFSTFILLCIQKKGYIASMIVNIVFSIQALLGFLVQKEQRAISGIVTPLSTCILLTIIYIFMNKINEKKLEMSKNYEQLTETNRIIKDKDEKLSYLAYYDILTGLPNRHLFIDKIDNNILNASNTPFTVISADIDNFKLINNTYGSECGDLLLADYAEKFRTFCGDSIFVGRTGGNEYGFIIQGNMTETNILNYVEKIQNIISEPVQLGNNTISSTASFGIASYPTNAVNSSDMLTCLTSAVSYAKANGKKRPCFYGQR